MVGAALTRIRDAGALQGEHVQADRALVANVLRQAADMIESGPPVAHSGGVRHA